MSPRDCPQWISCSAPICPLDDDWKKRTFSASEAVCLFLRETVKDGAAERLSANETHTKLYQICIAWIAAESLERDARSEDGMPSGRGIHMRMIEKAKETGSSLEKWAKAGERMALSRRKS